MNNLGQYTKALVPLVVLGFGMLGEKIGFDFGIDANAASVLLTLVTSYLVFLLPNKGNEPVVTPVVVPPVVVTPVPETVVAPEKPNILRKTH